MYSRTIIGLEVINTYSQILVLLLSSHVTLEKTLNLPDFSFSLSIK